MSLLVKTRSCLGKGQISLTHHNFRFKSESLLRTILRLDRGCWIESSRNNFKLRADLPFRFHSQFIYLSISMINFNCRLCRGRKRSSRASLPRLPPRARARPSRSTNTTSAGPGINTTNTPRHH